MLPTSAADRSSAAASGHLRLGPLWLGVGLALVAAVLLGSLSEAPAVHGLLVNDKVLHFGAYAVLMLWFAQLHHGTRARLALAVLFVALGVGVECLQGRVPSRHFDPLDMLANASGVALAWTLARTRAGELLATLERRWLPRARSL